MPGSMAMVLPKMTLSEDMVIARANFRVAVHQVRQGNLRYKGCCPFVQKDKSHCAVEGLWRPQAIPLVVVRYGEVGIHEVTHQDLLIRPKVVCAWWRYKCSSLSEWYIGAPKCFATGDNLEDLQVGSKWCGVPAAASEGWAASQDGDWW